MKPEDFPFAVRLTDTMRWNLAKVDFEFMTELEPEGCFVLLSDSEHVGIVSTISYGTIGWFGNLIVSEKHRRKGVGSLLAKNALGYLASKNVRTVGLYAYPDRIPFYEKLGFKYDSEFLVLTGKGFGPPTEKGPRRAGDKDIQQVIDYDSTCFSASRKKLLEPILRDRDNPCFVSTKSRLTSGYILAKVFSGMAEIGPLVCDQGRNDIAIELLKTALSRLNDVEASICVPRREEPILNALSEYGFKESFRVTRMFLGPAPVGECIYAAESLERG